MKDIVYDLEKAKFGRFKGKDVVVLYGISKKEKQRIEVAMPLTDFVSPNDFPGDPYNQEPSWPLEEIIKTPKRFRIVREDNEIYITKPEAL